MKAFSELQARDTLPLFIAFSASIACCSLVSRLFVIPKGLLKLPTSEIRFESCASGPFTVTVKLPIVELPAASIAVQFTVVVPIVKVAPDRGKQDTLGVAPELSVAVTV